MKVADLQEILAQVSRLLESAGGRGAAELATFRESLDPFRDLTAKQFANEIQKLLDTVQAKPKSARKAGKTIVDVGGLVREVQDLYAQASDPRTTMEQIEQLTQRLEPLTKDGLVQVAEGIELVGMKNKGKKGDILAAIRQRIVARKG